MSLCVKYRPCEDILILRSLGNTEFNPFKGIPEIFLEAVLKSSIDPDKSGEDEGINID